jgi:hypothetical protein
MNVTSVRQTSSLSTAAAASTRASATSASNASASPAAQEAAETPAMTALEAAHGDRQAMRLLASQGAAASIARQTGIGRTLDVRG